MIPYLRVDPPPPAPPEREPPDRPVEMRPPELPQITDPGTGGPVVAVAPPAPPEPPPRFMGTFGTTDGDALPIVKVLPVYPAAALTSSLEGHVIVEFTITRAGTVKDIVVIESSHRVFERSAVEAAAKFRYRPRVVNGEPVEVRGKQHLVSFALDPEDRR
jgi:protein TonB